MRYVMTGLILWLIFISNYAEAYGEYSGTAILKDGNRITVTLNTRIVPLFVFSPALPPEIMKAKVSQAIKVTLAEFDTKQVRSDKFSFAFPLRETLDDMLLFYGYKTDELQIASFEIGNCNGKVCRP